METRTKLFAIATLSVVLLGGCSSSSNNAPTGSGGSGIGGASSTGGSGSGGKTATGGTSGTGGTPSVGGTTSTGGTSSTGGSLATGGASSVGGSAATGGASSTGGTSATGGTKATGGATGVGGTVGSGGSTVQGGVTGSGGAGTGGVTPNGGTTGNGGVVGLDAGGKDSAGAEVGSDSGSTGFDPCPATGDCKILPLGDSITWGINYGGGYRIKLFTHTSTDNKNVTFVGYDTGNPPDSAALSKLGSASSKWVGKHEGHSGWTIQQDDDLVTGKSTANNDGVTYTGKKVVADFGPHIVLVHLGTNDLNLGQASGAPDRLGKLIDHIVADAPNALVVVAKIIPLPAQAAGVTTFNDAIPGVVKQRADAGKHVIVVDQFTGMVANTDMDSVHPKESGYEKMAVVWYNAIKPYLH